MRIHKLSSGLAIALLFSAGAMAAPTEKIGLKIVKGDKEDFFISQMDPNFSESNMMPEMHHFKNYKILSKSDFTNIISSKNAMKAAEAYTKGKAVSVNFMAFGAPSYMVDVATKDGFKNIRIAADTGKVLGPKKNPGADIYDALRGKGNNKLKFDLQGAMDKAKKEVNGSVASANLMSEPGNMIYSIVIDTEKDGRKTVLISGRTGKIIAVHDAQNMDMNMPFMMPTMPPMMRGAPMGAGFQEFVMGEDGALKPLPKMKHMPEMKHMNGPEAQE
ncbi:MAG: hypothetical protein COA93_04700 [Alphaproteobacteria bacterium]|nr:MAG: hypothetical protein COA93_04700 [Alphaproteobacteria bacterium]